MKHGVLYIGRRGDSNIDFTNSVLTERWIIRTGQKIYWKASSVWIYKAGSYDIPVTTVDICDGQATVPEGVEVFVSGRIII